MNLWLNIVLIVGPLLLGTYLSTVQEITGSVKMAVWIVCLFICISGVYRVIRERDRENKERYYHQLQQRQELYSRGLSTSYINGLGENPVLQYSFNMGQRYQKESKYNEAIEEYEKCLFHPEATKENKVAANILIGNCYYGSSKLKEAEKRYKKALSVSKRVKDKTEKLQGKVVALGNTGLVYRNLGNPSKALNYYKEALRIFKHIGIQPQIEIVLKNISTIQEKSGKTQT
ncbi:unnamed protein product [marine sediment metagenome]|uniref:Uncharacterized protein n=1 Tax=marine sediment metagenome TaxID=412755 RepID=X1GQZ0_9ZZZZ